ncbi:MAG: hypothetical protein IPJ82_01490 [Lewinellaceae bacterium]|nr:hypothetical protein [Lewinellaceae bacterium]
MTYFTFWMQITASLKHFPLEPALSFAGLFLILKKGRNRPFQKKNTRLLQYRNFVRLPTSFAKYLNPADAHEIHLLLIYIWLFNFNLYAGALRAMPHHR